MHSSGNSPVTINVRKQAKSRGGFGHISPFLPLAGHRGSRVCRLLRVVFDGDVGAGGTGSLIAE